MELRQTEVEELVTRAEEVDIETVVKMVPERRKWVARIMRRLLLLGEVEDVVSWDQFLWIFMKFCSLNRVELSQALFVIVLKESNSSALHYTTARDLQDFFRLYRECPVKAFNTGMVDFDKLPLTRYYASDFAELVQRFSVLLNPILHLQQVLQSQLPSSDFWDNSDPSSSFCRKITFEFFTMNPTRVYLRGEPPFRETCDMLGPDALGCVPVNQDQWILRTKDARMGRGLRQVSVWGEQPPPELIDLLDQVKAARTAAEEAGKLPPTPYQVLGLPPPLPGKAGEPAPGAGTAAAAPGTVPAGAPGAAQGSVPGGVVQPGTAANKAADGTLALPGQAAATGPGPGPSSKPQAWTGTAGATGAKFTPVVNARLHPDLLSIEAATLDEQGEAPSDCLPPPWMKSCTVAPAPVRRGSDPPIQVIGRRHHASDDGDLHGTRSSSRRPSK